MIETILRYVLAFLMINAGAAHFLKPKIFLRIVPNYLPAPLALVYISGFFEVLFGVGLLIPKIQSIAAWGLILLFIAVFPANVHMAIHKIPFGEKPTPEYLLWLRLPLQLVLIAWAAWYIRH